MKTLDLSSIQQNVRKLAAVKAILAHMETAYKESLAEVFKGFLAGTVTPVAIYGCVNSGAGSTYNISAGAIWHNGEMFTINAFAGTAGGGQVPVLSLVSTPTQLAYTDNTNHDTLITRTYQWSFGASGSGLGDFSALGRLATIINNTVLDVDGQVAAETVARSNADTTLQNNINAEAITRGNADTAETAARVAADIVLQANIDGISGGLITTVLAIGDWDMDSNILVSITVGIPAFAKIRSVRAFIRNDAGDVYTDLSADANSGCSWDNLPSIRLARAAAGFFDSTDFNGTGFSRGYVIIQSIP